MVREGRFREDLWFRINVFPIHIPPLRARRGDIPSLAYYFMNKKTRELKLAAIPDLAPGAMDRLMQYDWPGNVRELENVVEREMILNRLGPLAFEALERPEAPEALPYPKAGRLNDAMAGHIRQALESAGGRIHGSGGAADLLGINPSTLRSRMKKLGIPFGRHPAHRNRTMD